jgi:hypothetical protein
VPEERRREPRIPFAARADVSLGNDRFVCDLVNISASGALLLPPRTGHPGTFARFNLSLPALDEVLDVDTVVVRETTVDGRYAWGVQFTWMSPRTSALLRAYIQWALRQPPAPTATTSPARPPPAPCPPSPSPEAQRRPAAGRPARRPPPPPAETEESDPLRDTPGSAELRALYHDAVRSVVSPR